MPRLRRSDSVRNPLPSDLTLRRGFLFKGRRAELLPRHFECKFISSNDFRYSSYNSVETGGWRSKSVSELRSRLLLFFQTAYSTHLTAFAPVHHPLHLEPNFVELFFPIGWEHRIHKDVRNKVGHLRTRSGRRINPEDCRHYSADSFPLAVPKKEVRNNEV